MSVTTICPECGKKFSVFPSELRKSPNKCCSKDCFRKRRSRLYTGKGSPVWQDRPERFCGFCGKLIPEKLRKEQQFCSGKCSSCYHALHIRKENNPRWKGGPPKRTCQTCGRVFKKHLCKNHASGDGKYCSRECYGLAERGENNHAWKGGLSFEPYTDKFNASFKKSIRQRDNYICAICGNKARTVHHIDYDKSNTVEENCITVCRSCHGKTNHNRAYWEQKLTKILIRRHKPSAISPFHNSSSSIRS